MIARGTEVLDKRCVLELVVVVSTCACGCGLLVDSSPEMSAVSYRIRELGLDLYSYPRPTTTEEGKKKKRKKEKKPDSPKKKLRNAQV